MSIFKTLLLLALLAILPAQLSAQTMITPIIINYLLSDSSQTANARTLLAGKTFYVVGQEVSDASNIWGGEAVFDEYFTEMIYTEAYGSDAGTQETYKVTADGNKLIWGDDSDGSYTMIDGKVGDYIKATDYTKEGFVESHTRFYFDKEKADAYAAELQNTFPKFSAAYLNGKTLYWVAYDDFGYEDVGKKWNMAKMTFTDTKVAFTEYDTKDTQTHTMEYHISNNGKLSFDDSNDFRIITKNDDYLYLNDRDSEYQYMYFDEAKGKAYRDEQNQAIDNADLQELLVGKTFYNPWRENGHRYISEVTFQDDGNIKWVDSDKTEYEAYSIDGKKLIVVGDDGDSNETHYLTEKTAQFLRFDSETTFYFSKEDAQKGPADYNGGDNNEGEIKVSDMVTGNVVFEDYSEVPSNAWIRITPSRFQNDSGGWNGLICKIDSKGDFGSECYISHDEEGVRNAFGDDSETFAIAVFKNSNNNHHFDCGEDAYKALGNNEKFGSWENITVKKEDYQDRSGETCN